MTLTLNKITSQRGISVGEATKKISDLGWNPSYVQEASTFPTDYKITKAPRDPMKPCGRWWARSSRARAPSSATGRRRWHR